MTILFSVNLYERLLGESCYWNYSVLAIGIGGPGPVIRITLLTGDRYEVDIHDYFLTVEVSIGGVSIAGGTTSTNPDCLIWDIVGDGVYK